MDDMQRKEFPSRRTALESCLHVNNVHWCGDRFQPDLEAESTETANGMLRDTQGRFALAHAVTDHRAVLLRDKLGINKLFFAIHEQAKIVVASYLIDMVRQGVPVEAVYSVPAGHVLDVDLARERLELKPYFDITERQDANSLEDVAATLRQSLETWFSRLAAHFGERRVCVCLSGGVDSSLIAAFARRYFEDVTAYTYSYVHDGRTSEDAYYGRRVSNYLGIAFRFVPASRSDIVGTLDDALRYGQDWRDFNVHCAIVNEILARAIEEDWRQSGDAAPPLVLTGDLMNEFLANYDSVFCGGREYYRLPRVAAHDMRVALLRGLDAGDREVGIFARHGIDVVQPYGLLANELIRVPGNLLDSARCKEELVHEVAGDQLPRFVFERVKTRAQVGSSVAPIGVLPVLAECGYDDLWLQRRFCELLGTEDHTFVRRFVRLGRYRFVDGFPNRRQRIDGFYAG